MQLGPFGEWLLIAARSFLARATEFLQSAAEVFEQIAVSGLGDVDRLARSCFASEPFGQLVAGGSHVPAFAFDWHAIFCPALRDCDRLSEKPCDGRPSGESRGVGIFYRNLGPLPGSLLRNGLLFLRCVFGWLLGHVLLWHVP